MAHQTHNSARDDDRPQQVLIEAGRVLTESLEYEATLQNVARLLVPALADWCVVHLVQSHRLEPVAVMHMDPKKVTFVHELHARYPVHNSEDRAGAPRVIRSGESEVYAEIGDEHLQQVAQDEQQLKILRELQLRSGVVVPLVAHEQRLGAMTLASGQPRRYSEADLPLMEELGRRCGVAVDNARSHRDLQRELAKHRKTQQALRESEQRFRAMFDQAAVGVVLETPEFRLAQVNERFCQIVGYSEEELLAMADPVKELTHPEDLAVDRAQLLDLLAGRRSSYQMEKRYVRKDGQIVWVDLAVAVLRDENGQIRQAMGVVDDITARKEVEQRLRNLNQTLEQRISERTAELRHRASQLQAMASQLTQAEQRERRRLAQVLHDHLQQLLVASKLQLGMLSSQFAGHEASATLEQVVDLLDQSIETSRTLTVELSPPVLYESGLVAALEWLGRWNQEKHGLAVHFDLEQMVELNDENLRVLVFQAVRELLFNVVKHAGVREAWIQVRQPEAGLAEIVVADRGQGFDAQQAGKQQEEGGFGLFSIHERLELMGGRMSIWSQPGKARA